jgi:predicted MFS family arabinose efflux permease
MHSSNLLCREPDSIGIANRHVTKVADQVFVVAAVTGASTFPDSSPHALTRRLLQWLLAVAMFMELLDTSILNTAVPTIAKALGVAPLNINAALTSYMLSLAVFIPISGWIADRFGTRRVFFSAIGLFTFGSLLCGLAMNMAAAFPARCSKCR